MAALRGAPSALRFSKAFDMNITKDTAVTINYKITDKLGKLLDKGDVAYLHGGYDNIFSKVEAALDGKAVGDTLTVDLAVEDAFGARDRTGGCAACCFICVQGCQTWARLRAARVEWFMADDGKGRASRDGGPGRGRCEEGRVGKQGVDVNGRRRRA